MEEKLVHKEIAKDKYQENVRELFNTQMKLLKILKGITLDDVKFPEEWQKEDPERFREFCRFCHIVYVSPFYKIIIESLIVPQMKFSVNQAANYDETTFGRATVNGISLHTDFFQKYSNVWASKFQEEEPDFDPHKMFDKPGQSDEADDEEVG